MLENAGIRTLTRKAISEHKIAGATLIVRKGGEAVYDAHYGYADIENKVPIDNHTILRLASMTKPIVAISVMILQEKGLLDIDDPLHKYLPRFAHMKVADRLVGFEDFYEADPDNPAMPKMKPDALEGAGLVDAMRPITLRDMLTHSSGMGQGPFSMRLFEERAFIGQTLAQRVGMIAGLPLDFQPGTHTGYSANVAFDVLGRVVEVVSGVDLNLFIQQNICEPLGCRDLTFALNDEQKRRLAHLYESHPDSMRDVSDTEPFWQQVTPLKADLCSGLAGMLGTVADYDRIARMLANGGALDGVHILKPETVGVMRREASARHLELCPGMT